MVLACDKDKPVDTQPRIFGRTLTVNQQRKLLSAMSLMRDSTDPDRKMSAALDAAEVCLSGWENMTDPETGKAIPFSRDSIGDILSIDELAEVFNCITEASSATPDVKKKSESQR